MAFEFPSQEVLKKQVEASEESGFSFPPSDTEGIVQDREEPIYAPEPSNYEKISAGLGGAQASFRENIVAPITRGLGMEDEADSIMSEAKEQQEYSDYISNQSDSNAIQIASSLFPEFVLGGATKAKALGQGALEFGLSYSRNGDVSTALRDAVIASGLTKAGDKFLEGYTQTGKAISKIDDPSERKKINSIFDNLEESGVVRVDDKARTAIVNSLDLGNKENISDQVVARLVQQKGRARDIKNKLYDKANSIASQTEAVNSSLFKNDVLNGITPSQLNKDELESFNKISSILDRNSVVTAEGLEDKLKSLKKAKEAGATDVSYLYDRAIDKLQAEQDKLLIDKGIPNIYKEAREADMAYKRDYIGSVSGTGSSAGKKIKPVLEAQDNYEVSQQLLTTSIRPQLASQMAKNFSTETKRNMVMDILSDGVDATNLDSREGVTALLANFGKMNPEGVKILIGNDGYKKLATDMETLGFIQSRMDSLAKQDQDIAKDVLNLLAGVTAFKVSPFASVHVAINSSKAIANKKILKGKMKQLVKRVETIEDKPFKKRLLNGINTVSAPYIGDIIAPQTMEAKELGLTMPTEGAGINNKGKTVDSNASQKKRSDIKIFDFKPEEMNGLNEVIESYKNRGN